MSLSLSAAPLESRVERHGPKSKRSHRGKRFIASLHRRAQERLLKRRDGDSSSIFADISTMLSTSDQIQDYCLEYPEIDSSGETEESSLPAVFHLQDFKILTCNIRSLVGKVAELMKIVEDLDIHRIFLQETWLDASVPSVVLPIFTCLTRKARSTTSNCGGVATFVREDIANITFLQHSSNGDRSFLQFVFQMILKFFLPK